MLLYTEQLIHSQTDPSFLFHHPVTRLRPADLRPRKHASAVKRGSRPRRRKSSRLCPRRKRPRNKISSLLSVHSGFGSNTDQFFNKNKSFSVCLCVRSFWPCGWSSLFRGSELTTLSIGMPAFPGCLFPFFLDSQHLVVLVSLHPWEKGFFVFILF